jgi:hypothetical protein
MNDDDPPAPRVDVPDGWMTTETTTERVFAVSKVTVTATTVVYEDERLHDEPESERESGDTENGSAFRRFVFASRLQLRPTSKPSKPLTKLVTSRAKAGFADRLRERGMRNVEETESRRLRVGDADATLVGYDAECTVEGTRLAVDGWVAVWPHQGGVDGFDPSRYRDELFSIIRTIR